ncbi:hypothetical protein J8I29_14515 [Labrys sp. LIt4]|uniref:hypothetical protein n=1 Tax=Labrys TaxID=204476 RepID=UPI0015E45818|nr:MULTISPECIES: hypothetical protein [Labrys]MBP0580534.1 hypothetical protein [Labrys sp. LIt4]
MIVLDRTLAASMPAPEQGWRRMGWADNRIRSIKAMRCRGAGANGLATYAEHRDALEIG